MKKINGTPVVGRECTLAGIPAVIIEGDETVFAQYLKTRDEMADKMDVGSLELKHQELRIELGRMKALQETTFAKLDYYRKEAKFWYRAFWLLFICFLILAFFYQRALNG